MTTDTDRTRHAAMANSPSWWQRIKRFMRAPSADIGVDDSHRIRLLSAGLNLWLVVLLVRAVALFLFDTHPAQRAALLPIISMNLLLTLGFRWLTHAGFTKLSTYGFLIQVWLTTTFALAQLGTLFAPLAGSYVLLIVMAGVLEGRRMALICAALSAAASAWVTWRVASGVVAPIVVPWPSSLLVFLTIIFATAAFVDLAINEIVVSTKRAEEAARSREVAIAANQAKTDFLARVSHELRTPLNGILGFSEVLKTKATDPMHRKSAEFVHTSGLHLLTLVNSLLDLSQIESGAVSVESAWFDLDPLLQEIGQLHAAAAAAKSLEFKLILADGLPASMFCDATRLRQILNNLCHNAVKFTDAGEISLRASARDDGIEFRIRDTGPGIDESHLPTLFERFNQREKFTSRSHGGAGLGLALAKELTELLGGRISVESRPGHGSEFTVWLPASNPPSPTSARGG